MFCLCISLHLVLDLWLRRLEEDIRFPGYYGWLWAATWVLGVEPGSSVRGHQIPWHWSYGQLWAAMWALVITHRSFVRTESVLSHWAIYPAPANFHFNIIKRCCRESLNTVYGVHPQRPSWGANSCGHLVVASVGLR